MSNTFSIFKNNLMKLGMVLTIIVTYFSVNSILFCIFKETYSYDINKLFSIPKNQYLFILITVLLLFVILLNFARVNKSNGKDRVNLAVIIIVTLINITGVISSLLYLNGQRISTKYLYGDYKELYKTIVFTLILYTIINILYYLVNFRRSEKNNADFYCICCIFIVYFIYAFPMLVFGFKYDTHISAFYREFESKITFIDYFLGFYKLGFSIFFIVLLSIYDIIKNKKNTKKRMFIRIVLYFLFVTILMTEFYYYYHYLFENRSCT